MITKRYHTNNRPLVIECKFRVNKPTKIRLIALNEEKKGAVYLDRWKTIKNNEILDVRLPHSSKNITLKVIPLQSNNNGLQLSNVRFKKLNQHYKCYGVNYKTKEFLQFAKEFSDNLPLLKPGTYYSDKKRYRIDLFDVIKDKATGKILTTPARISNSNGRIEVAKKYFNKFTIPMRLSILCHEYSHFYLNKNQKDEIEADQNGLKLYLGMGYPYIEAHKSFLHTFMKNTSKENKVRYEHIKKFADNFEKLKYKIC